LLYSKWSIFQIYHGKTKLHFDEMIDYYDVHFVLYQTRCYIFIVVANWNNSPHTGRHVSSTFIVCEILWYNFFCFSFHIVLLGESGFLDKYWKFSTINIQDPLKICQKCIPHLLKYHQISMNFKNCLDLCQKNWNQSKYWKLLLMYCNLWLCTSFILILLPFLKLLQFFNS